MSDGPVLCDVTEGVALVTVNRPDVRNAIDLSVVEGLGRVLDDLAPRGDVRAMILTGAGGKAFASGADIAELRERTRDDAFRAINTGLFKRLEDFPRPTIAAIVGFCLGGGMELAMACDLRVSGTSGRFGQPEVGLGIMPGAGATYRLPRLVGLGKARELIYTGEIVDAAEALRIGLVNRVVDAAEVLPAARAMAERIAAQDPLAVRVSKMSLSAHARPLGDAAMALEMLGQAVLFESPAKRERMTAFLEKRGRKK
jgi:enoyl-CoA hydratase